MATAPPWPMALVEIWQCDVHGKYLRPADDSPGPRDENFQGYGQARTDASGGYAFRTIRPVAYSGRPPHIHFLVSHPRHRKLVTQLYAQEAGADGTAGKAGGVGRRAATHRCGLRSNRRRALPVP